VLVVDDDAAFAAAVLAGLAEEGTVDVVGLAKDGVEALELSKTLRPDVMLLDLEMPRMDGFQVLRTLNRRKQRPVVIVLTGLSAREDLARAERLRPNALMQKTVDVGALIPGIVLSFALGGNGGAPQGRKP
jgi:CheY-like chemotaxis protein